MDTTNLDLCFHRFTKQIMDNVVIKMKQQSLECATKKMKHTLLRGVIDKFAELLYYRNLK